MDELNKIIDRYTEGNYLIGKTVKQEMAKDILALFSVSVSDSSEFELQRLFDWLQDPKREPAQTKFTAGMTRNVAREFEYLLKHSR